MSQSLAYNYLHITFSTRKRELLIKDSIKVELFNYLGGICKQMECNPIRVGGCRDHVHILCLLSKKIALISFMEELKKSSSKWIKIKETIFQIFIGKPDMVRFR